MIGAREQILGRIRTALGDVPAAERATDVPVPRDYRRTGELAAGDERLVARLTERLRDYRADVIRCPDAQIGARIATACLERGLRRLAIPPALEPAWHPPGVELVADTGCTPAELDALGAALTGCAAAIAETGTLVLDGGPRCGRRALTLIPDHHICVVERRQIVQLVPEGLAVVGPAGGEPGRPLTLISGPSASSDIELTRIEGVHGPRHLLVVIAEPGPRAVRCR